MRKLIITLDNVVRGTSEKLGKCYEAAYPKDTQGLAYEVTLLGRDYAFVDAEDARDFLLTDFVLEIFGHANEHYKQVAVDFNNLQNTLLGQVDISLFASGVGRQVPATFFFLSKIACQAQTVQVFPSIDNLGPYNDIVLGAHKDVTPFLKAGKRVFVLGAEQEDNEAVIYIDRLNEIAKYYQD